MEDVGIRTLLRDLGYEYMPSETWYHQIDLWRRWYKGKTSFHTYQIYNGTNYQRVVRKSLRMAKHMSEDKADLLLNEKAEIRISENQLELVKILEDNNFWESGNELVEFAHALGTGAFVEYIETSVQGEDRVRIDYIKDAGRIWPLSWTNNEITECAFASMETDARRGKVIYLSLHVLENGVYVIYNYCYDARGQILDLPPEISPRWTANSAIPTFQIVRSAIANNFEEDNPMGVSIFANSIDTLKVLDAVYDSYYNEFILGRKRIFADATVLNLQVDEHGDGTLRPVFDPNDTVFYNYPGMETTKGIPIVESNMELRVEQHKGALQDNLDLLSEQGGFGKGYYKFTMENVQTATGVISQNSKLYRKIRKEEIRLTKALRGLAAAIIMLKGWNLEQDISISYDDNVVEDTNTKITRALLERQDGVIDDVMYFMQTRDLSLEAATVVVDAVQQRLLKSAPIRAQIAQLSAVERPAGVTE